MKLENYIYKTKFRKFSILLINIALIILFFNILFSDNILVGFSKIGNLLGRMFPLDLEFLPEIMFPLAETIFMSLLATFLAIITTIIILPFQTNIIHNNKVLPKILSALFSIVRTVPSLIIAAVLVSLFSVGSFSGFISLYLISFLMSIKLLKEYAEEIDKKYIDTFVSMGLSKYKIYLLAVIQNLKANIYSTFFLTLESSIRGASILGLVGAGGIGQILWKELNHLRYDRVGIIILSLIIVIIFTDFGSYYFRKIEDKKILTKISFHRKKNCVRFLLILMIGLAIFYSYSLLNISSDRFIRGMNQLNVMLKGLINPDFNYINKTIEALSQSLLIALMATFLASVSTIFLSYLFASNLIGYKKSIISKIIINFVRTFPPIIIAIIFFRGFGPGVVSSFFALYIYTLGIMTKMYGEVLENIDDNILVSLKSMGIKNFVAYIKIIFPGYLPEFITISLYRFEMNIKNSAILGMVGAGGIGQLIINNIEFRNWNKISMLLIVLSTTIIIIENISNYIREKIKR